MATPSEVREMLHRLVDLHLQELSDDQLDQLFLALQLERGRRWQLRRRHPEVINP
jgi:hypothetical protein